MRNKINLFLLLFGLIAVDQTVKLVINQFFINCKIYYKNLIGFCPYLNTTQLGIFNKEMALGFSLRSMLIINALGILILFFVYFCAKSQASEKCLKYYNYTFLFVFSGAVCSLIDKIFYGGSLDYVLFIDQIFDLKDVYLVIAMCYCFVWIVAELRLKKYNERNKNLP